MDPTKESKWGSLSNTTRSKTTHSGLSLSLAAWLHAVSQRRPLQQTLTAFIERVARINTKLGLYEETSANHLPGQEKGHGITANHLPGQEKVKNARMHPKRARATQKKYAGCLLRSVLDPLCQERSPPHSVLCHYLRVSRLNLLKPLFCGL